MTKPCIVQVDGGIGRVICSLPAIEKLSKSRKVIVITTCPEVFWNNPNIYKVYNLNREYLWDDVIRHGEFLFPEPYFSHFYYNQEHHLIQSFNYLLNGEKEAALPTLYLTQEEKAWASDFIGSRRKEHDKDVVMLQCFGSLARCSCGEAPSDTSNRSLPTAVVDAICKNTNCLYINASHIPMNYPNVWQQEFNLRQLFALTACCDFVVTIDSFLMHTAAALNKNGVVFFGSTFPQNLGYSNFQTFQRKGYPKSYTPNRFSGFIDENKGALDFDTSEVEQIVEVINNRSFPKFEAILTADKNPQIDSI